MKQAISSSALLLVSVLVQQQRPLQPHLSPPESLIMLGPNSVTPTTLHRSLPLPSAASEALARQPHFWSLSSLTLFLLPLYLLCLRFRNTGQTRSFVFSVCIPSFSPWPTLTSLITLSVRQSPMSLFSVSLPEFSLKLSIFNSLIVSSVFPLNFK